MDIGIDFDLDGNVDIEPHLDGRIINSDVDLGIDRDSDGKITYVSISLNTTNDRTMIAIATYTNGIVSKYEAFATENSVCITTPDGNEKCSPPTENRGAVCEALDTMAGIAGNDPPVLQKVNKMRHDILNCQAGKYKGPSGRVPPFPPPAPTDPFTQPSPAPGSIQEIFDIDR